MWINFPFEAPYQYEKVSGESSFSPYIPAYYQYHKVFRCRRLPLTSSYQSSITVSTMNSENFILHQAQHQRLAQPPQGIWSGAYLPQQVGTPLQTQQASQSNPPQMNPNRPVTGAGNPMPAMPGTLPAQPHERHERASRLSSSVSGSRPNTGVRVIDMARNGPQSPAKQRAHAREALSEYIVKRFVPTQLCYGPDGRLTKLDWTRAEVADAPKVPNSEIQLLVEQLSQAVPVTHKIADLPEEQQRLIQQVLRELQETDDEWFQTELVQLDDQREILMKEKIKEEKSNGRKKGSEKRKKSSKHRTEKVEMEYIQGERLSLTAYYKRSLRPNRDPFEYMKIEKDEQKARRRQLKRQQLAQIPPHFAGQQPAEYPPHQQQQQVCSPQHQQHQQQVYTPQTQPQASAPAQAPAQIHPQQDGQSQPAVSQQSSVQRQQLQPIPAQAPPVGAHGHGQAPNQPRQVPGQALHHPGQQPGQNPQIQRLPHLSPGVAGAITQPGGPRPGQGPPGVHAGIGAAVPPPPPPAGLQRQGGGVQYPTTRQRSGSLTSRSSSRASSRSRERARSSSSDRGQRQSEERGREYRREEHRSRSWSRSQSHHRERSQDRNYHHRSSSQDRDHDQPQHRSTSHSPSSRHRSNNRHGTRSRSSSRSPERYRRSSSRHRSPSRLASRSPPRQHQSHSDDRALRRFNSQSALRARSSSRGPAQSSSRKPSTRRHTLQIPPKSVLKHTSSRNTVQRHRFSTSYRDSSSGTGLSDSSSIFSNHEAEYSSSESSWFPSSPSSDSGKEIHNARKRRSRSATTCPARSLNYRFDTDELRRPPPQLNIKPHVSTWPNSPIPHPSGQTYSRPPLSGHGAFHLASLAGPISPASTPSSTIPPPVPQPPLDPGAIYSRAYEAGREAERRTYEACREAERKQVIEMAERIVTDAMVKVMETTANINRGNVPISTAAAAAPAPANVPAQAPTAVPVAPVVTTITGVPPPTAHAPTVAQPTTAYATAAQAIPQAVPPTAPQPVIIQNHPQPTFTWERSRWNERDADQQTYAAVKEVDAPVRDHRGYNSREQANYYYYHERTRYPPGREPAVVDTRRDTYAPEREPPVDRARDMYPPSAPTSTRADDLEPVDRGRDRYSYPPGRSLSSRQSSLSRDSYHFDRDKERRFDPGLDRIRSGMRHVTIGDPDRDRTAPYHLPSPPTSGRATPAPPPIERPADGIKRINVNEPLDRRESLNLQVKTGSGSGRHRIERLLEGERVLDREKKLRTRGAGGSRVELRSLWE